MLRVHRLFHRVYILPTTTFLSSHMRNHFLEIMFPSLPFVQLPLVVTKVNNYNNLTNSPNLSACGAKLGYPIHCPIIVRKNY